MRKQTSLSAAVALRIACTSLRARFLRSALTTISLLLAVAFLAYIQTENILVEQLKNHGGFISSLQRLGYSSDAASLSKQRWLLILSLLVCAVGIINAQLMSVSERFREIGTLKCLGALDGFVVRIFLFEATIQGLIGSLSGALLGIGAASLSLGFHFGGELLPYLLTKGTLLTLLSASLIGTTLSLLGALYPARVAAKMLPVEALRQEQ